MCSIYYKHKMIGKFNSYFTTLFLPGQQKLVPGGMKMKMKCVFKQKGASKFQDDEIIVLLYRRS